jgi:hypothetical protein
MAFGRLCRVIAARMHAEKEDFGDCEFQKSGWGNLKKVLEGGRFSLPDSDLLQADLVSCGYKYQSDGKLLLESKQDMRRRGVPSPDEGDAVALCFSEPDGSPFIRRKNFNRDISKRFGGAYV